MKKSFLEALVSRRSYYQIGAQSNIPEREIIDMIDTVILSTPSAFNSQSTRIVVLLDDSHRALWEIVKDVLRRIVEPEDYPKTEEKIESSFAAGCGTILFFEDQSIIEKLREKMPVYADQFESYSAQTSAMHQLAIWTLLEEMGFGASLQHYNPLIDKRVAARWLLPAEWRLVAQMPFGVRLEHPVPKEQHLPIEERRLIFR